MNFPVDFVRLIMTLYKDNNIRIKVNGYMGKKISPRNGVKQGCGLSPALYICTLQPFISLLKTHPDKPEGIQIPGTRGLINIPITAFADDLNLYCRKAEDLSKFKYILSIYENGSNALNSWEKTMALKLGPYRQSFTPLQGGTPKCSELKI